MKTQWIVFENYQMGYGLVVRDTKNIFISDLFNQGCSNWLHIAQVNEYKLVWLSLFSLSHGTSTCRHLLCLLRVENTTTLLSFNSLFISQIVASSKNIYIINLCTSLKINTYEYCCLLLNKATQPQLCPQGPFPGGPEQFPPFQDPRQLITTWNVFRDMGNVLTLGTSRMNVAAHVFNLCLCIVFLKKLNESMMD